MSVKYKRVVLKLSGEALGGKGEAFDADVLHEVARQIIDLQRMGIQVALVIGAGNIWRGRQGVSMEMDPATADYMGMMGTAINALAMQDAIERLGKGAGKDGEDVQVRTQAAIEMRQIAEPYVRRRAIRHLEKGRVVIFACGTGSPFFTTDTAAALRAAEIDADAILLAKNTDYIYDMDPKLLKEEELAAHRLPHVTYKEVIDRNLGVMDLTAITVCMEKKIPLLVFGLRGDSKQFERVVTGEFIGSIVSE